MHCVNSSIFWSTFNALPYITPEQKARLLEWKGRLDLAMYASRRSPKLYLEEVATYVPKELERGEAEWNGIFGRLFKANDDGHAVKLARAVAHAEKVCGAWENSEWARIKGFMWEKIGNMVVDSVEDEGATWYVRSVYAMSRIMLIYLGPEVLGSRRPGLSIRTGRDKRIFDVIWCLTD